MPQHLAMFDFESAQSQRSRLHTLDVSECGASVTADKEYILSRISDVQAFNLHLRTMLLDEKRSLFAQWLAGARASFSEASDAVQRWDELSTNYTYRLRTASVKAFLRSFILVSMLPLLINILSVAHGEG